MLPRGAWSCSDRYPRDDRMTDGTERQAPDGREPDAMEEDCNALRALVHRTTGISLAQNKRTLVYGRLARRLGPLDVIFCRNVVIYFDKDTQRRLFERY